MWTCYTDLQGYRTQIKKTLLSKVCLSLLDRLIFLSQTLLNKVLGSIKHNHFIIVFGLRSKKFFCCCEKHIYAHMLFIVAGDEKGEFIYKLSKNYREITYVRFVKGLFIDKTLWETKWEIIYVKSWLHCLLFFRPPLRQHEGKGDKRSQHLSKFSHFSQLSHIFFLKIISSEHLKN